MFDRTARRCRLAELQICARLLFDTFNTRSEEYGHRRHLVHEGPRPPERCPKGTSPSARRLRSTAVVVLVAVPSRHRTLRAAADRTRCGGDVRRPEPAEGRSARIDAAPLCRRAGRTDPGRRREAVEDRPSTSLTHGSGAGCRAASFSMSAASLIAQPAPHSASGTIDLLAGGLSTLFDLAGCGRQRGMACRSQA
jgi:hypothetical protein